MPDPSVTSATPGNDQGLSGLGEVFSPNLHTGTGTLTVPVLLPPGRSGFAPQLTLSYGGGANGPFGIGWNLPIPAVMRTGDGERPTYRDHEEADRFMLVGAGELVLALRHDEDDEGEWVRMTRTAGDYDVHAYRPRVEAAFARIERWVSRADGSTHWRTESGEGVVAVYGASPATRVVDPEDPSRVYQWLLERTYDDRGNVQRYAYKAEDLAGVGAARASEAHRLQGSPFAGRYLKRIQYGNTKSYDPATDALPSDNRWLFEVVFDYGDHDEAAPTPEEERPWPVRPDPFSSYGAGFEVRTYRLCLRVLVFHRFPEGDWEPQLASSFDVAYDLDHPRARAGVQIKSLSRTGYRSDGPGGALWKKRIPPLSFTYTEASVGEEVHEVIDAHLPSGIDGLGYRPVDLYSEGLSGVLAERGGAWYYQENRGGGQFGPLRPVPEKPAAASGTYQLGDLDGDGRTDLVHLGGGVAGFYEVEPRTHQWEPFRPFQNAARVSYGSPYVQQADLTGDGRADLAVSEPGVLTYFASDGERGFESARRVPLFFDEALGPPQVAADPAQGYFFANLSGSGGDVVRVRNGEVCYWPSLGHGRFGRKVAMDRVPMFDHPDSYDPARLRFVDLTGTGVADILYLGADGVRYWLNEAGNGFSEAHELPAFPALSSAVSVQVMDLLGEGTPCLVWSSPLPQDAHAPLRYVRLQAEVPPHLLASFRNNMGRETRLYYRSSSAFYLADKEAGQPWHGYVPSHTTVLERAEQVDYVTGSRLHTRYAYHGGYFDGEERTFRGFGLVEQYDTETFEAYPGLEVDDYVEPTLTKTWFHNGACGLDRPRSPERQADYYDGDPLARRLPGDVVEEAGAHSAQTVVEAYRSLAGRVLRQEVYAADGKPGSEHPYTVTETAYRLRPLQPVQGEPGRGGYHGVFLAYASETLSYHYEQVPRDPRVTHQFVLAVDAFGYETRTCEVAYPRRPGTDVHPEQEVLHAVLQEADFLHAGKPFYRHGIAVEARSFELGGLAPPADGVYRWETVRQETEAALQSQQSFSNTLEVTTTAASRQIGWERAFYYDGAGQPTREAAALALPLRPHHTETAVFDEPIVGDAFGARVDRPMLEALKYVLLDGYWWRPSPVQAYLDGDGFFLPEKATDPFGNAEAYAYDERQLAPIQVTDARGNVTAMTLDPFALAPRRVIDPNENISETLYDPLGNVVVTTAHGEGLDADGGVVQQGDDPLSQYTVRPEPDPEDATADSLSDIVSDPAHFLQGATAFYHTDLFAWMRDVEAGVAPEEASPASTVSLMRETHVRDLAPGEESRMQIAVQFVDGFGRTVQAKQRVEAGPALVRHPELEVEVEVVVGGDGGVAEPPTEPMLRLCHIRDEDDVEDRWLTSGGVVYNNKGLPIEQYEPLFTGGSPHFEPCKLFMRHGETSELRYDPLGRHVETITPKGFLSETRFTPWEVRTYDENDTVKRSRYFKTHVELDLITGADKDAIDKALKHVDTPQVATLDPLGQPFLTQELLDPAQPPLETHTAYDIQGNPVRVVDPRQRRLNASRAADVQVATFASTFDMLGRELYSNNIDRGERWMLADALDRPAHLWTARDVHLATTYDALSRPTETRVTEASRAARVAEQLTYGEDLIDPQVKQKNLLGRLAEHRDGAGVVVAERYDFRGLPLGSVRRLRSEYKAEADWSSTEALETEAFRTVTAYDALGRVTRQVRPDGSTHTATYLRRGPLQALHVRAADGGVDATFVEDVQYNARGQRTRIRYGNDVQTTYTYDTQTFRLQRLFSQHRTTGSNQASRTLQEIDYAYDPVGNLTWKDDQTRAHLLKNLPSAHNDQHRPSSYDYDALYRLTEATGWIHGALGQNDYASGRDSLPPEAFKGTRHLNLNNGQVLTRYKRTYGYDEAGNMLTMQHEHVGPPPAQISNPNWTRTMWVDETSNRSLPKALPGGGIRTDPGSLFDAGGDLTKLEHLKGGALRWNYRNELVRATIMDRSDRGGDNDAEYYVYGADGMRVRKVLETVEHGQVVVRETIYLGGCEIYRERAGGRVAEERVTCHVQAGDRRVALVHQWTVDESGRHPDVPLMRYQLNDHLGSSALEVNETGQLISYEEYFPYGGSALVVGNDVKEVRRKAYRYSGKERDDATGLYYYGFRYYASWMGRWLKPDPDGMVDGLNLYQFIQNSPLGRVDIGGLHSEDADEEDQKAWAELNRRAVGFDDLAPEVQEKYRDEWERASRAGTSFYFLNPEGKDFRIESVDPSELLAAIKDVEGVTLVRTDMALMLEEAIASDPNLNRIFDPDADPLESEEPTSSDGTAGGHSTDAVAPLQKQGDGGVQRNGGIGTPEGQGEPPEGAAEKANLPPEDPVSHQISRPGPSGTSGPGTPSQEIDWWEVGAGTAKGVAVGVGTGLLFGAAVAAGVLSVPILAGVGIGMLLAGGLLAFDVRSRQAEAADVDDTAKVVRISATDALGVTGLYEGYANEDALTGQQLGSQERSRRLGAGAGAVGGIVAGGAVGGRIMRGPSLPKGFRPPKPPKPSRAVRRAQLKNRAKAFRETMKQRTDKNYWERLANAERLSDEVVGEPYLGDPIGMGHYGPGAISDPRFGSMKLGREAYLALMKEKWGHVGAKHLGGKVNGKMVVSDAARKHYRKTGDASRILQEERPYLEAAEHIYFYTSKDIFRSASSLPENIPTVPGQQYGRNITALEMLMIVDDPKLLRKTTFIPVD